MYDPFIEISKKIAELQMKDKEKEKAKNTYSLDGEIILPVLKHDKAPINAVTNNSEKPKTVITTDANGNAMLPTLSTEDKAGLKSELNKHTTVTTPTIPGATAPEGDKKDGETTDAPSNEINLSDILANLQKGYVQSDEVKQALANWNKHMESRLPDWNGGNYLNPLNAVIGQINNRDPFKYDVNADALYHMYRDLYMQGGKMAMQDTMGQSAMMTGGYGNSYSATAGNQAYQGYLQQLNGVVPELYQLALNKYNAEGDALYDKASLYKSMYDQEYDEHLNKVDDWYNEGNRLGNLYQTLAEEDYTKYVNDSTANLKLYQTMVGDLDGDGKKDTSTESEREIPADILARLDELTTSEDVEKFLENQVNAGRLNEDEASDLLLQYEILPLMERDWSMVDDGGANWLGLDRNGKVKDNRGNEYKLVELRKAIEQELREANKGKPESERLTENAIEDMANSYVMSLQKRLGISDK